MDKITNEIVLRRIGTEREEMYTTERKKLEIQITKYSPPRQSIW